MCSRGGEISATMKNDNLITGICVTYNTKEAFETTYNEIRKFHPDMKIIRAINMFLLLSLRRQLLLIQDIISGMDEVYAWDYFM